MTPAARLALLLFLLAPAIRAGGRTLLGLLARAEQKLRRNR